MSNSDGLELSFLMDRWPTTLVRAAADEFSAEIRGYRMHCDGCGARTPEFETLDDAASAALEAGWLHVANAAAHEECDFCPTCLPEEEE